MYYVGLDSGSTTTKGILLYDGQIVDKVLLDTAGNPKRGMQEIAETMIARNSLKENEIRLITTGYGRKLMPADLAVTEITCHAKGARYLDPEARKVIDIGGQDCKTIALAEQGMVSDFNMNDKCAAGTGRFVEVMMRTLGQELQHLDAFVKEAQPTPINSMCTVFAESEIISLLANGSNPGDIALGVLHSIARRISNQFAKLGGGSFDRVLFTGGLSRSEAFTAVLAQHLSVQVLTHDLSQYAGALGAALVGEAKLK